MARPIPPPELVSWPDRRCRRDHRCPDGDTITWREPVACDCRCHAGGAYAACDIPTGCADLHPAPVEHSARVGALLNHPAEGFCPTCYGRLALALDELPELYLRLSQTHIPTLAVRYRTDDITGGGDPHPAIPLNAHASAVADVLDHELATWADHVADAIGMMWSQNAARRSRGGDRVNRAAQLLLRHQNDWLALTAHVYPARSTAVRRTAGHDPDTTTIGAREAWCELDGPAAALRVLAVHGQAVNTVGLRPQDDEPGPCPYCSRTTLRRDHATCVVRCRTCGGTVSDDAYARMVDAVLAGLDIDTAAAAAMSREGAAA